MAYRQRNIPVTSKEEVEIQTDVRYIVFHSECSITLISRANSKVLSPDTPAQIYVSAIFLSPKPCSDPLAIMSCCKTSILL